MNYEVEMKFRIEDLPGLERRLTERGAAIEDAVLQADLYYAHPSRDFASTDEALRIRRVGDRNFVTYKGPKIDAATKTRQEIEVPIDGGASGAERFAEMLAALGFRRVLDVHKRRRLSKLEWQGHDVEIALDKIDGLGAFAELEIQADEPQLDSARTALLSLAESLGLSGVERRSYLELLLADRRD